MGKQQIVETASVSKDTELGTVSNTMNHPSSSVALVSPSPTPTAPLPFSRPHGPSVNDFTSENDLRNALERVTVASGSESSSSISDGIDWRLPVSDEEAEPQKVDVEMQRLLTLKSYLVLDAESEEAFDRLTEEACQHFQVPTSLISLVDLGRQFLFSGTTYGESKESSRNMAFCAHTILNKNGILVVNDTHKDARFQKNVFVTQRPHLRFYAGAPLVSPEGMKLGTFCVEGPDPRPGGFSPQDKAKLQDFATKAMGFMVERRERLRVQLDRPIANETLRQHAAVTTNLGGILYQAGECVTAMKLYQESVQTAMCVEQEGQGGVPHEARCVELAQILNLLSSELLPDESRPSLLNKVIFLCEGTSEHGSDGVGMEKVCRNCTVDGLPGLFGPTSRIKRVSDYMHAAPLVFSEAFKIIMDDTPIDERQFMIPLAQSSKATLFNMGLIHYHWGSPDTAMQFFDLSSSLSEQLTPLAFDPVVLGCLNNMAQIHLQYGRPADSLELLSDALVRGNAALAAMYGDDDACHRRPHDVKRSRRLRRKLARTVMNMGHVHFFNCDFDKAMTTCTDALRLLHTNMDDMEVAAVWYNIALLRHHQGDSAEALSYLNKFLDRALEIVGPLALQLADGLHRKGQILYEMGNLYQSMRPLNAALKIRQSKMDKPGVRTLVADSMSAIGKVFHDREEYDFALNAFRQALAIQRPPNPNDELSFEGAQTLLEIGRALHSQGERADSLVAYLEVLDVTRKFFGERHPFVARLQNIVANLYLEQSQVAAAMEYFGHAMKIYIESRVPFNMAVVQDKLCRVELIRINSAGTA
jgi:tetratricopeptide (TPR) repeat protein